MKYAKFIDKLIKSAFRVDREDLELSVDIAGETLALPLERPQTNDGSDRVQLYPSSEYYAGMKASQRGAPGGLSEELGFNVVDVYSLSCTEQCGSIAGACERRWAVRFTRSLNPVRPELVVQCCSCGAGCALSNPIPSPPFLTDHTERPRASSVL